MEGLESENVSNVTVSEKNEIILQNPITPLPPVATVHGREAKCMRSYGWKIDNDQLARLRRRWSLIL
jgi:hypothetical protein